MTSQDRSHVLPLEPFSLSAVPLTTHNLAWSPDAELAIASDDCVYLFLPEFPSAGTTASGTFGADYETQRQYHEISFRFPVVELRPPELNRHLFAASHQPAPNFSATFGNGLSVVANLGTSLNHAVAIEWSPPGLGRMQRAVLAVLTGTGTLTIFCEGVSDGPAAVKIKGRNIRSISSWLVPWAVGDNLVVPRSTGHEAPYSKERITSFAWARATEDPGALLAYVNDEDEVVILSVQSRWDSRGEAGSSGQWLVEEVGRFLAHGPHPKGKVCDGSHTPQRMNGTDMLVADGSGLLSLRYIIWPAMGSVAEERRKQIIVTLLHDQKLRRLPRDYLDWWWKTDGNTQHRHPGG